MANPMTLDEAATVMRAALRDAIKRNSVWYLLQGGLMVLAGIVALVYPIVSSVTIILMLGWLLIISGIAQAISLIDASKVPHFWPQLISVVLSVLIGILLVRNPGEGLLTLTLLMIVYFMVGGMAKIIFALTIRPFPNWIWLMASGIVGVILAIYLWSSLPLTAAWLLGVLVGIQLICEGAALAYMAWQVRNQVA